MTHFTFIFKSQSQIIIIEIIKNDMKNKYKCVSKKYNFSNDLIFYREINIFISLKRTFSDSRKIFCSIKKIFYIGRIKKCMLLIKESLTL